MLQWFRWLMPRQEMFFPLFESQADAILKGARALRQMLDGGAELGQRCQDVTTYEHAADEITREILIGIRTSFITPFDRADIRNLVTSMDDTIDQMQQTAKSIILFEMTTFGSEMRAMADVIVECAELVSRAMPLLANVGENAPALNDICVQITRAEGRADEIHDRGLRILYHTAKTADPMDFVRGNQVYEHLEESVDRFDDVANEIQGIVIEHV